MDVNYRDKDNGNNTRGTGHILFEEGCLKLVFPDGYSIHFNIDEDDVRIRVNHGGGDDSFYIDFTGKEAKFFMESLINIVKYTGLIEI